MTVFEALPTDIGTALYHYCKDDECLNDAMLRALRNELKIDQVEHDKYSHDCFRCDKFKEFKNEVTAQIADLEQENAELKKSIKYVNTICERKSVTNSQLTELAADSSAKLCEAKEILTKILNRLPSFQAKSFDDLYLMNALSQAEQFLSELNE